MIKQATLNLNIRRRSSHITCNLPRRKIFVRWWLTDVLQKSWFLKFRETDWRTPLLDNLFNTAGGFQWNSRWNSRRRCFPFYLEKSFRTLFLVVGRLILKTMKKSVCINDKYLIINSVTSRHYWCIFTYHLSGVHALK